ncbi:MAG: HD domain-containing protein [Blautia sp.]|nr:HD domain-containing protein [Blautia sp.]
MMKMLEEAIITATILHQGKIRKFTETPYILHPIEVAQILSMMTSDEEIITAGILHDVVEDTDGTLEEIEKRFGKRVAELVDSESENKYPEKDRASSWNQRKAESLQVLKNSKDIGVQMLWLADKLSNIRSLAGAYAEYGEELWEKLNQKNPVFQCWYYKSVAEIVELRLNKTGAFKEFIKHINFIWPGTFDSSKARYKKYKEVSMDGCKLLGRGAKGCVYRYDDELVVKVFNQNNTYRDVEEEVNLSRKAFILGIPTSISFGIVSVGDQYGAMYELLDSVTVSDHIAKRPKQVEAYAAIMAELALKIHSISVSKEDGFSSVSERLLCYINEGIGFEDEALAERCRKYIDAISAADTLVHGDFHTGNVFLQKGEPLLIDMGRIASGHPIAEISDIYYFYVVLGEDDPAAVEKFMGFSYETACQFFVFFLKHYLDTDDEDKLREVKEKASILCYIRKIRKLRRKGMITAEDQARIHHYLEETAKLAEKLDTLVFDK